MRAGTGHCPEVRGAGPQPRRAAFDYGSHTSRVTASGCLGRLNVFASRTPQIPDWLAEVLPAGARVGIDPFCHTVDAVRALSSKLQVRHTHAHTNTHAQAYTHIPACFLGTFVCAPRAPFGAAEGGVKGTQAAPPQRQYTHAHTSRRQARGKELVPLLADGNLVDAAWGETQPPLPLAPLRVHAAEWAGQGVPEKLSEMRAKMKGEGGETRQPGRRRRRCAGAGPSVAT